MEAEGRKVSRITVYGEPARIYALCEDGTIWVSNVANLLAQCTHPAPVAWEKLPPVPTEEGGSDER